MRAGGRRDRAADRVSAATTCPASCWPARCAPMSIAMRRAPGRRVAVFTNSDDGWRTVEDLAARRRPGRGRDRSATELAGRVRALATGCSIHLGGAVRDAVAAWRLRAMEFTDGDGSTRRLPPICLPFPAAGIRTSHLLASWRPSRMADGIAAFVPADPPAGMALAGAAAGRFTLAAALADGARCGRRGRGAAGLARVRPRAFRASDEALCGHAALAGRRHAGKAFVDFQNDVTAKDVAARRARGLSGGRASQALHHARHGDRPGQDLERQRPRHHGRAHRPIDRRRPARRCPGRRYVPVAIGAFAGHASRRAFPADPADAVASTGPRSRARSFVETGLWLRRAMVSARRRDRLAGRASTARCSGARRRRLLRRLDARQDRRAGPGRRRLPRPRLHQHLLDASRSARRATA